MPRLPAPGRRVAAPAQSGAVRFTDGGLLHNSRWLAACAFSQGAGCLATGKPPFRPQVALDFFGRCVRGALPRQPSQARSDFLTVACCTTPVGLRLQAFSQGAGCPSTGRPPFRPQVALDFLGGALPCRPVGCAFIAHRCASATAQRPPRRAGWGGGSCLCTAGSETGRGLRRSRLAGKRRAAT